jgi:hypothetical protein
MLVLYVQQARAVRLAGVRQRGAVSAVQQCDVISVSAAGVLHEHRHQRVRQPQRRWRHVRRVRHGLVRRGVHAVHRRQQRCVVCHVRRVRVRV